MAAGTAKIAQTIAPLNWFVVFYVDGPRRCTEVFHSYDAAWAWCRSRNLKII